MNTIKRIGVVLGVLTWPSVGLTAQPAADSAAASSNAVVIPFSPPLDREIRYRFSRLRTTDGKAREAAMNLLVSFTRTSDGFEMRTRIAQIRGVTESPVDELFRQPIVFELSRDGSITGIVNEGNYWKLVDSAIERSLTGNMENDQSLSIVRNLMADMRKLSDDQRLALIAKNYQPILEMTGVELTVGETVEGTDEGSLPFPSLGNVSFPRQLTLTLEGVANGIATFRYVTHVDPEVMKSTIEKFLQLVPPEKRTNVPLMKFRQEAIYVVSSETGLTEGYEETIEVGPSADSGTRVTKLVLVKD